jgi:AcrR family transcriptional regulator
MPTPVRLLQATADAALPGRTRYFSAKQRAAQDQILAAALAIMAQHGRAGLTMGRFAVALGMAAGTIRRHFVDLDCILAELLSRHLLAILQAFRQVPEDAPNRKTALRAAYIATTRNGYGGLTDPHALLLRERHTLPPDLATSIEQTRASIGKILAGPHADAALALLDTPSLTAAQIETMLAQPDAPKPAPQSRPGPKPERRDLPAIPGLMSANRQDLLTSASITRPQPARPRIPATWIKPKGPEPRSASP